MRYDWNFNVLANQTTLAALANGLLITVELTVICIIIGTPIGFLVGCLPALTGGTSWLHGTKAQQPTGSWRAATLWTGRLASKTIVFVFVDVIRAIPLLLLMLTCYYGIPHLVPSLVAVRRSPGSGPDVSAFTSAAVAMAINLAAFVADLVRAGLEGVPRGSVAAGLALGMGRPLVIRRIVLPEVLRDIWPSLVLLYITMLKMSTLASAITVWEILHSAESIIQNTYRVLEIYLAVCMVFVAIIVPLSMGARRLERSEALRRRS